MPSYLRRTKKAKKAKKAKKSIKSKKSTKFVRNLRKLRKSKSSKKLTQKPRKLKKRSKLLGGSGKQVVKDRWQAAYRKVLEKIKKEKDRQSINMEKLVNIFESRNRETIIINTLVSDITLSNNKINSFIDNECRCDLSSHTYAEIDATIGEDVPRYLDPVKVDSSVSSRDDPRYLDPVKVPVKVPVEGDSGVSSITGEISEHKYEDIHGIPGISGNSEQGIPMNPGTGKRITNPENLYEGSPNIRGQAIYAYETVPGAPEAYRPTGN